MTAAVRLLDLEGRALPTTEERAAAAALEAERAELARVGLTYQREPDPSWVAAVAELGDRSEMLSWLVIHWEPGDAWEPVQRWIVYTVLPPAFVPPRILEQLRGPHPRSSGHACVGRVDGKTYCLCRRPRGQWVDGPAPLITRTAWEIFHRYGGWARPYYVIQGAHGGHRYRWHPWEAKLSQMLGGPKDTPAPGDLPYAEPDGRTWAAIRKADLALKYRQLLGGIGKGAVAADRAAIDAAKECVAELLKWMDGQIASQADELAHALRRDSSIARPAAGTDIGAAERRYDPDHVNAQVSAEMVADLTGTYPEPVAL